MVRLSFTPSDTGTLQSKTSKKKEINLNPLEQSCNEVPTVKQIHIEIIGLENCKYVLKNWFYTIKNKNATR